MSIGRFILPCCRRQTCRIAVAVLMEAGADARKGIYPEPRCDHLTQVMARRTGDAAKS